MADNPSYYSVTPADVRYDNRLTDSEKLLYSEITALTKSSGECWATNEYFASLYDVHITTISRRIANLKKYGYIDVIMVYKENKKQIEKRVIRITNTYTQDCLGGISRNANTPISRNAKENNTSNYNNTSINNKEIYKEIIDYLNLRTGKRFKATDTVKKSINGRLAEGFELDDFKEVIDKKCVEWINNSKMKQFLRPSTLFGTKFQNYLNQDAVNPNATSKSNNPFLDMIQDGTFDERE